MDFKALFKKAVDAGASDIHLHGGRKPVLRVHGTLIRVGETPVAPGELHAQITQMLPDHLKGQLSVEGAKGLDFSYTDSASGRFRCSAYYAVGQPGVTMRAIRGTIPSIETAAPADVGDGHRALAARADARDRDDRQRQEHDAGGDDRPDQQQLRREGDHGRGPDRIPATPTSGR